MIKKLFSPKLIIIYFIGFLTLFGNCVFGTSLTDSKLYCKNSIAMDLDSGNILYGKNEYDKIYPASTTKILTAILVIENLDLDKEITVSQKVVDMIPYNSSAMGVKAGEIFTVRDLLHGLMLPSGNDAALVLAEAVSGNVNDFVTFMNSKLKELNINNTHFTNPHGYHDDNHYSTPSDMANLFKYCLQNETFKQLICTLEYELKPTNLTTESRMLRNTSRISDPKYTEIYYEYILGGKTGYTDEANGTYVGYASKDEKNIIICVFNGLQNINGNQARFLDTKTLAEYCFNNFERKDLINISDYKFKVYDLKTKKYYILGLNDNISGLFKIDENYIVDYKLNVDFEGLSLLAYSEETSKNNSTVGFLNIYDKNNELVKSSELVFVGSQFYLIPTNKTYSYLIPLVTMVLFIILISFSLKK